MAALMTKRAARIAKVLADSSAQLDALVSQFLELARAEAGMPNEDRVEIDLGALARGVAETVAARTTNDKTVIVAARVRDREWRACALGIADSQSGR